MDYKYYIEQCRQEMSELMKCGELIDVFETYFEQNTMIPPELKNDAKDNLIYKISAVYEQSESLFRYPLSEVSVEQLSELKHQLRNCMEYGQTVILDKKKIMDDWCEEEVLTPAHSMLEEVPYKVVFYPVDPCELCQLLGKVTQEACQCLEDLEEYMKLMTMSCVYASPEYQRKSLAEEAWELAEKVFDDCLVDE